MILLPAVKLVDIPDVMQSLTTGGGLTNPINSEWFDLTRVPIGAEFRLDCDHWRNVTLRRTNDKANVEIVKP